MSNNFSIARAADQYVRDQMKVKAANRAAEGIEAREFDAAEQTKIPLEDSIAEAGVADDGLIDCLAWAAVAQRSHISNCLGMASLALAWVALKHPGARPVGVYGFKDASGRVTAAGLEVESALLANVSGGSVRLSPMAVLAAGQTLSPAVQGVIGIT